MAYDLEEQEKLDAIRDWWARHGTLILGLVLVAAASVAGWRGWQWYESHKAGQAMGYFEALERAAGQNDEDSMERIRAASETLRSDFSKSGYTPRGLLIAAEALHDHGDVDEAIRQLQWITRHSKEQAMVELARLRISGLYLGQGKHDAALDALDHDTEAFEALYADRRGDVYHALGDAENAQKQWRAALSLFGDDPLSQVVQLKLDALTGV